MTLHMILGKFDWILPKKYDFTYIYEISSLCSGEGYLLRPFDRVCLHSCMSVSCLIILITVGPCILLLLLLEIYISAVVFV